MNIDRKHRRVSPLKLAAKLDADWSPRVISELEDAYIKVARLKGEFDWHSHEHEDELFYILEGELIIQFEDSEVSLKTGDLYVIPKGVRHNPIAEETCLVMLIEQKDTQHTGETESALARSIEQQLRPLD